MYNMPPNEDKVNAKLSLEQHHRGLLSDFVHEKIGSDREAKYKLAKKIDLNEVDKLSKPPALVSPEKSHWLFSERKDADKRLKYGLRNFNDANKNSSRNEAILKDMQEKYNHEHSLLTKRKAELEGTDDREALEKVKNELRELEDRSVEELYGGGAKITKDMVVIGADISWLVFHAEARLSMDKETFQAIKGPLYKAGEFPSDKETKVTEALVGLYEIPERDAVSYLSSKNISPKNVDIKSANWRKKVSDSLETICNHLEDPRQLQYIMKGSGTGLNIAAVSSTLGDLEEFNKKKVSERNEAVFEVSRSLAVMCPEKAGQHEPNRIRMSFERREFALAVAESVCSRVSHGVADKDLKDIVKDKMYSDLEKRDISDLTEDRKSHYVKNITSSLKDVESVSSLRFPSSLHEMPGVKFQDPKEQAKDMAKKLLEAKSKRRAAREFSPDAVAKALEGPSYEKESQKITRPEVNRTAPGLVTPKSSKGL